MNKFLLLLFILCLSLPVTADVTVEQPLSFGEVVVRNNNSVSTTTVARNGSQQSTNQILILKPGAPAIITLSNFPAFIQVNLSVDLPAFSQATYPGTAQMEVSAVDMQPSINVNASGSAQFKMGGTLRTSGTAGTQYYSGANYTVYLNLNIDY